MVTLTDGELVGVGDIIEGSSLGNSTLRASLHESRQSRSGLVVLLDLLALQDGIERRILVAEAGCARGALRLKL